MIYIDEIVTSRLSTSLPSIPTILGTDFLLAMLHASSVSSASGVSYYHSIFCVADLKIVSDL